ncbi:hypothetical protein NK983_30695, partial [Salmonella enterica subsp. enterica serovar Typhimurium]|nr:hypothetical protein [Salmonella enterica subsp. enterica serovar Typhimurium]
AAWYYRPQLDENLAPVVPQAQPVQQPAVAAEPVPAPEPPPIQHPVQAIEAVPPPPAVRALPPLGQSDARAREDLNTLLGRKKVEQF